MRLRAIRNAAFLLAAVVTIGCDRVTKHVAMTTLPGVPTQSYLADTIRVVYTENPGGFLGAGADMHPTARTLLFTVLTGLCLLAMAAGALMRRWNAVAALGLALFLAGGASNWYDRVARGSVVDFLNVGLGPVRTGIFNAADVAIMLGAILFVFGEVRRK
jgi:signal peptidase II